LKGKEKYPVVQAAYIDDSFPGWQSSGRSQAQEVYFQLLRRVRRLHKRL